MTWRFCLWRDKTVPTQKDEAGNVRRVVTATRRRAGEHESRYPLAVITAKGMQLAVDYSQAQATAALAHVRHRLPRVGTYVVYLNRGQVLPPPNPYQTHAHRQ